jgi:prepilin-type N-terminal cleavage/methylation domain-containing protein
MKARGAFTLLEVVVVIAITGIVALVAYGTAAAGFDTDRRLERVRTGIEARAIIRDLLVDALRHPSPGGGSAMNDVLFEIDDAVDARGRPTDAVRFRSRGLTSLGGATASWAVTLEPRAAGLRVRAEPIGSSGAVAWDAVLADVRGLDVRVRSRTDDSLWSDGWDALGRTPAAVRLEFLAESGAPAGPPLVVHTALEAVR